MHDARLGSFAVDPLSLKYSHYSSYQFSGNKTIAHVEMEGAEEQIVIYQDDEDPTIINVSQFKVQSAYRKAISTWVFYAAETQEENWSPNSDYLYFSKNTDGTYWTPITKGTLILDFRKESITKGGFITFDNTDLGLEFDLDFVDSFQQLTQSASNVINAEKGTVSYNFKHTIINFFSGAFSAVTAPLSLGGGGLAKVTFVMSSFNMADDMTAVTTENNNTLLENSGEFGKAVKSTLNKVDAASSTYGVLKSDGIGDLIT
ncbi:MAG: hypothetical protein R2795_20770 [Saprospiraceae bacterium]